MKMLIDLQGITQELDLERNISVTGLVLKLGPHTVRVEVPEELAAELGKAHYAGTVIYDCISMEAVALPARQQEAPRAPSIPIPEPELIDDVDDDELPEDDELDDDVEGQPAASIGTLLHAAPESTVSAAFVVEDDQRKKLLARAHDPKRANPRGVKATMTGSTGHPTVPFDEAGNPDVPQTKAPKLAPARPAGKARGDLVEQG